MVKDTKNGRNFSKKYDEKKIEVGNRIFQDFSEHLINKKYKKLDWNWIGDLSWDIEIILNKEVESHLDFDKKLAARCKKNTIRYLNIYISDIIPAYSISTFSKYYRDNIYEFGPLVLTVTEKKFINSIKSELKKAGYYFVNKKTSLLKFKELRSDLNEDGNASIFDCLFNDVDNYTEGYTRFLDKKIKNVYGFEYLWIEYYNSKRELIETEHSRWYKSGDYEATITDKNDVIKEITIRPKHDKPSSIEINIEKLKLKHKNKYSINL